MLRRPPISTRTDTLFPDTTLFRSRTEPVTIVDVGSGGGLPGVVVAATNPGWDVYCEDAVDKKMAFVRQMRGELNLPRLHAVHGRVALIPSLDRTSVVMGKRV